VYTTQLDESSVLMDRLIPNEKTMSKGEQPKESESESESEWLKRIKNTTEEESAAINVNDPKYWSGPRWIGPMFMKSCKTTNKQVDAYHERVMSGGASSVVFIRDKTQYSRDNVHWYDSWDETFSQRQVDALKKYEDDKECQEFFRRMNILREEDRVESEQHYQDTGEMDAYAWVQQEKQKYEEYCKQFEYDDDDMDQDFGEMMDHDVYGDELDEDGEYY